MKYLLLKILLFVNKLDLYLAVVLGIISSSQLYKNIYNIAGYMIWGPTNLFENRDGRIFFHIANNNLADARNAPVRAPNTSVNIIEGTPSETFPKDIWGDNWEDNQVNIPVNIPVNILEDYWYLISFFLGCFIWCLFIPKDTPEIFYVLYASQLVYTWEKHTREDTRKDTPEGTSSGTSSDDYRPGDVDYSSDELDDSLDNISTNGAPNNPPNNPPTNPPTNPSDSSPDSSPLNNPVGTLDMSNNLSDNIISICKVNNDLCGNFIGTFNSPTYSFFTDIGQKLSSCVSSSVSNKTKVCWDFPSFYELSMDWSFLANSDSRFIEKIPPAPSTKLYYPESFIASPPSFSEDDNFFLDYMPHVLLWAHIMWVTFICLIIIYFVVLVQARIYYKMRKGPKHETRGASRSKCADLSNTIVPASWAVAIVIGESSDTVDYYHGFGTGEIVSCVRGYQWGWEYYYPNMVYTNLNDSFSLNTVYNQA